MKYKTIVVSPNKLRIKGDDHSEILSKLVEDIINGHFLKGWTLNQVIPSLMNQGALTKVILVLEKKGS